MKSEDGRTEVYGPLRKVLFTVGVGIMFALGVYSLFLASANAGKVRPLRAAGLVRTATAGDHTQISHALGSLAGTDLAFVVIHAPYGAFEPDIERAASAAAQSLKDSGLEVGVRILEPSNPDYLPVVRENGITHFPAVLAVRERGGIVLVTSGHGPENLIRTYQTVWGKKSDCGSAKDAVY